MSEEDKKEGLVIKDKRRFDSEGNERSDEKPAAKAAPADERPAASPGSGPAADDYAAEGHAGEEINFSSFVVSLATQALIQLGEIKPPEGMPIEIDPAAAKQTIDILGVLQAKTRGNLDSDEERLLDEILRNVRISYVKSVSVK